MPEQLYPTKVRLALLADVDAGRVADDATAAPYLDLGDGSSARIAGMVWQMERAGWVEQPPASTIWQLTGDGRALLDTAAAEVTP